jgi:hypothetical protein
MVLPVLEPFEQDALAGTYLKIDRAKEHLDSLRAECEAFSDREPYTWFTEFEDRPDELREYEVFAEIHENPHPYLGLIAGDVIQNLRSALDQLVWSTIDPARRSNETGYPISLTKDGYKSLGPQRLAGATDPARTLIEKTQPYNWGARAKDHPLAILRHLSNLDKHRTLLPVALVRRNQYVTRRGEVEIVGFTYLAREAVNEDAPVMRFLTRGEPAEQVNVNPYLTFEIAIEGRTLVEIESIFEFIRLSILSTFDPS